MIWLAWFLLLGGGGFLAALLIATPLRARGVRRRYILLIGLGLFLLYNVFWIGWSQAGDELRDATGIAMFSPLQLFGWVAGIPVATALAKQRARITEPS